MKNDKTDTIADLVTGSILILLSMRSTYAEQPGLPVPSNGSLANSGTINELTSPSLHADIDVGHASATVSADGHKLTIHQTTDKAVLDWQRFDIAAGNKVQYVQPSTTSIALNNIHQVDASQIFGSLSANGQVYLVNANGFVFGNNASVNTNTLVATTLKITDSVLQQGISKVVDANASDNNLQPVAALTGDGSVYRDTGNGNREKINILIEKGAAISADKGGRVILAAPSIQNKGTITANDGQVILAAATDKVYLQETDSENLRGLLVEVQTGGDIKNVGKVLTERGNTTMLGFAVSQQGIISASTSVDLNGSIRLLAREGGKLTKVDNSYKLQPSTTQRPATLDDDLGTQATLTLAGGSKTTVSLDNSAGTAVDGQAQPQSIIELTGAGINVKSGAQATAHGGNISLIASTTPDQPLISTTGTNLSQIVLEPGSLIDVSGVKNVQKTMASNVVNVELRNDELRDAPIQKNGVLHGKTIAVDMRKGTTIADISGATAKIGHNISERNSSAGSVNVQSEGDVLVGKTAKIDVSGGSVHYQSGLLTRSQLLSDGVLYDLANADPNRTYQKIVTNQHFEPGYYQGGDAGTVNIKSRGLVFDGIIDGSTQNGLYQRQQADWTSNGLLTINTAWSNQSQQDIVFANKQNYTSLNTDNPITSPLYLSNALFSKGLNRLTVTSGGKLSISPKTNLKLPNAGQLSLQAGEIDVQGSIYAPSGAVLLKTQTNQDPTRTLTGQLHAASDSRIDTSGLWSNDTKNPKISSRLLLAGGNIDLQAQGDLLLDEGSHLAANGGAWLNARYQTTAGDGGSISLSSAGLKPSQFKLAGQLSAYSLSNGGKLSLTANSIAVTNTAASTDTSSLNLVPELLSSGGFSSYALTANAGNLSIAEASQIRLQQQSWLLKATALSVASGGELAALVEQTLLPDDARKLVNLSLSLVHNAAISGGYDPQRQISIGKNANISSDIEAILSLNSDSNILIDGTLQAPAGEIDLNITVPPASIDPGYNPNQAIVLTDNAKLSTSGATVMTANAAGLNLGDVKAGGSISINADRGYIITSPNSSLDVSGTSAQLDIVNSQGISRQTIASNAGKITMSAAEGLLVQGQMHAQAGVGKALAGAQSTASGGSLSLELNAQHRNEPEGVVFNTAERVIHVTAQPITDLGNWTTASIPASLNGAAYISAGQIKSAGFDSVLLKSSVLQPAQQTTNPSQPERGEIRFDGDVQLTLKQNLDLDAPLLSYNGNKTSNNGQVLLSANTISLGSSWNQNAQGNLAIGSGKPALFSLTANNIDLRGAAEINGFTETQVLSNGDIRLVGVNPNNGNTLLGSLGLGGNLTLSAQEIFPTTFSQYKIAVNSALNPNGQVTIKSTGATPYTPLSAAGKIEISAANIIDQGNILAPFGSITLSADKSLNLAAGSLTSVSASATTIIPFGRSQGNLDWIYPLGLYSNIQEGTPQKTITLSAPAIGLADGAKVNLDGGGDLSTFEFIPGPGGSIDVLDTKSAAYQQNYAILPSLSTHYAPYDALEFPSSGLHVGDSIYLSADAGVKAGNYVLLPAHYALLPGAYLITPQQKTTDLAAGTTVLRSDGAKIVAGYRFTAGTNVADSRWSGFAVEPGTIASTRSEYQQSTASQFFKDTSSAALPQDAGNLSLLATQQLNLAGQVSAKAATGGLGGMLDISALNLAIVQKLPATASTGQVNLLASQLNNLGVDSILLGGRRTRTNDNTQLQVSAKSVTVAGNVHLQAPEILLAANDNISIASGADISAVGTPSKTDTNLSISNARTGNSDGAFARISNADAALVNRDSSLLDRQTGSLTVAEGANLTAQGSIFLDASKNNNFQGNIAMPKGTLTLSSSVVTLGGTDNSSGLNLSESSLNTLQVDSLTLNSYSSVNLGNALNLHFKNLTIDASSINGFASAGQVASLQAHNITLQNLNGSTTGAPIPTTGNGTLVLQADTINLASGNYDITGFQHVDLTATNKINNIGTSIIGIDSDMALSAPLWTAQSGANTTVNLGQHTLTTSSSGNFTPTTGLGARLSVNAKQINHQGRIGLASGSVNFHAVNGINLAANSLIDNSGQSVPMASGSLTADAGSVNLRVDTGDLLIAPTAAINLSAAEKGGNAGSLSLMATQGELHLSNNINAFGYLGGNGGSFSVDSLNPVLENFSNLNSFLSQHGFNNAISIRQRQGDVLVAASDTLTAHDITVSVDTGALSVSGKLDVSGKQAGNIQLSAGDALTLASGSQLHAASQGDKNTGGNITLSSLNPDGDSKQGLSIAPGARLNVAGSDPTLGGSININVNRLSTDDAAVSIAANTVTGTQTQKVIAMAQVLDATLSNAQIQQWRDETQDYMDNALQNTNLQTRLAGFALQPGLDIQSAKNMTLDLADPLINNTWQQSSTGQIWTTTLDKVAAAPISIQQISQTGVVKNLTTADSSLLTTDGSFYFDSNPDSPTFRQLSIRIFANSGSTVAAKYNPNNIKGELIEHNGWDFELANSQGQTWRFGQQQVPGLLSLRTAGDFFVQQKLSDGFALYDANQLADLLGTKANWMPTQVLQTGASWSFNLVAGADLHSAALTDVQADNTSGNLTIGSNVNVRTGTGDISVAAAGDIKLTDWTSSIYTSGRANETSRYGSFSNSFVATNFFVEYPMDGGDLTIQAGGNIIGAESAQLMSDWLQRTGNWDAANGVSNADTATAWGIDFDSLIVKNSSNSKIQNLKFGFRENLGALGGGNITIQAGKSVQDLSVMLPSTAKPVGKVDGSGLISENIWQQQGGGNLKLSANGNIAGGVFYVDQGIADINAKGAITGGSQYTAGPIVALGDSQFSLNAGTGVKVGGIINPFTLTEAKFLDKTSYFSTYSANSSVQVQTLAGDISFNNDTGIIQKQYKIFDQTSPKGRSILSSASFPLLTLYPGNLSVYALSGGLQINNSLSLFSTANSSLDLKATGDISFGNSLNGVTINQMDVDPKTLLSPASPNTTINTASQYLYTSPIGGDTSLVHAATPVHDQDIGHNQIISNQGSIKGIGVVSIALAKATDIVAALDMDNVGLQVQNLHSDDITSINIGRDILYPLQRDLSTGAVQGSSGQIQLAGPGLLAIWAGRNIDLGSSDGITTVGALLNPALPDAGADITVLAGNPLNKNMQSLADFLSYYSQQAPYHDASVLLQQQTTNNGRLQIALGILFTEIRSAAKDAAISKGPAQQKAYQRGYDAIARLFPDASGGDIKLFFSRIQTLEGGNINLLAPGGMVNAGLASAFTGQKDPAQLGIVAQRQGDINILVKGNLQVNQSRVFTLDAGDITAWSSAGNIDAGRGAKSAIATPRPKVSIDANGNLTVEFPATVSGSGIRAQSGFDNDHIGNVTLAAPKGVIDAGEAGIGGQDITLASPTVIGASNIQSLGTSFGLASTTSSIVLPSNTGNAVAALSRVSNNINSGAEDDFEKNQQQSQNVKVAFLDAQVIGFGDCSIADVKAGKPGCGKSE